MTFLRILNAFCVHLCPSLGDTYSTNLCISLAFYVHLALQCSLARAFSVHLISILAHSADILRRAYNILYRVSIRSAFSVHSKRLLRILGCMGGCICRTRTLFCALLAHPCAF
jgi:hypothetical protein